MRARQHTKVKRSPVEIVDPSSSGMRMGECKINVIYSNVSTTLKLNVIYIQVFLSVSIILQKLISKYRKCSTTS